MTFGLIKYTQAFFIIFIFAKVIKSDYIKSDEIIINDETSVNTELINLNELIPSNQIRADTNIFKFVQDTSLVDYIYISNAKVYLKNKLNFIDLCKNLEKECMQILKIIAVTENHFVEIPFRIEPQLRSTTERMVQTTTTMAFYPLNYEFPSYSIVIEDNIPTGKIILEPSLKSVIKNKDIIFILTEESSYFSLNSSNGKLSLKKDSWDILKINNSSFLSSKIFSLKIKASYKTLMNTTHSYNYMYSAFTNVKVTINHLPANVTIQSKIMNAKVLPATSHDNIDGLKKLIELNLNEPLHPGTNILSLDIKADSRACFKWIYKTTDRFFEAVNVNHTSILIKNKIEPRDLTVYKIKLQLQEEYRISENFLLEIDLILKVDFDPIIFENKSFSMNISNSNIVGDNLIQIKTKPTYKNSTGNIEYLLSNQKDFLIDQKTGWIKVLNQLKKNYYRIQVTAKNSQNEAYTHVEFNVVCDSNQDATKRLNFEIFENSPNMTKFGQLKSICSSSKWNYNILDVYIIRFCDADCTEIKMSASQIDLSKYIHLEKDDGYLFTNNLINSTTFQSFSKIKYGNLKHFDVYFDIIGKMDLQTIIFRINIKIHNAPKIYNFYKNLILSNEPNMPGGLFDRNCIYNYKYRLDKTSFIGDSIANFVRINSVSGSHLQAEYSSKDVNACSVKFLIQSDGCLALKLSDFCQQAWIKNKAKLLILKSNIYQLEFKLCYYESNKVACSKTYNQTVIVNEDLYTSSKISIFATEYYMNEEIDKNLTNLSKISSITGMKVVTNISTNIYFIVLSSLLILTFIILIVMLLRFKYFSKLNKKFFETRKEAEGPAMIKDSSKFSVTHSENSTKSNNLQNLFCEISSHTLSTSSKLSKTDDENEPDTINIRVSDDYIFDAINQNAVIDKDLSYSGSFSSISSGSKCSSNIGKMSSCNTISNEVLKNKQSTLENTDERGLYSVKNASICYNNSSLVSNKDLTFHTNSHTTPSNIYFVNPSSEKRVSSKIDHKCSLMKISNCPKQQEEISHQNKCCSEESNSWASENNYQIEMTKNQQSIYDSYYINRKETCLNPSNIIASIV